MYHARQPILTPRLKACFLVALVALTHYVPLFLSTSTRLITSFVAADPFENDGVEWVRLTVKGQSFMMHQIRKMVSFVLCQLLCVSARTIVEGGVPFHPSRGTISRRTFRKKRRRCCGVFGLPPIQKGNVCKTHTGDAINAPSPGALRARFSFSLGVVSADLY